MAVLDDGVLWQTRLGFSLNVVPQIMKTIISAVLSQEETVERAMSTYFNDIYINENVKPVLHIQVKLAQFGLDCKDPERLEDGVQVLGLDIWGKDGTLRWRQGSVVLGIPEVLTRQTVFSLCEKLVGYLPVCGWLCTAMGITQPRANVVTSG